ncbi:hypothetical protein F5141DRAFT_1060006 [Pisolithus sp. B1]|nr:hypothetical protein F5141DRAFT_1060006 [Pisolithus sp. B1]
MRILRYELSENSEIEVLILRVSNPVHIVPFTSTPNLSGFYCASMLQLELSFAFFVGDVCIRYCYCKCAISRTTYSINSAPLVPLPTPSGIPKPSAAVSPATATILCTRSTSHDLLTRKRLTGQGGQGVMEQKRRRLVEKARPLSADIPAPGPQYISGREPGSSYVGACEFSDVAAVRSNILPPGTTPMTVSSMPPACMQTFLGRWAGPVQLRSPPPGLYTVPYILPLSVNLSARLKFAPSPRLDGQEFGGVTIEGCLVDICNYPWGRGGPQF